MVVVVVMVVVEEEEEWRENGSGAAGNDLCLCGFGIHEAWM